MSIMPEAKIPSTIDKICIKCIFFTGLWDLGESTVMIYSKYALTKVVNAAKMNLKCLYTYVDQLLQSIQSVATKHTGQF